MGNCLPAFAQPALVCVHGFGVSSSYFVPLAKQLALEFPTFALDLPGHGKSATPPKPLNVPDLADHLVAWMHAIGLQSAVLVGNSMGCQTVVDAAVRYPERASMLVLISPTADPSARTFRQHFFRLLRAGLYERLSLYWLVTLDYLRMGLRLIPELRALLDDRIDEKLPQVRVPVMLVRGAKDPIVPPEWLHQAARLANARRVVVIPDGGHAVHHSAPDVCAAHISSFVREMWGM